MDYRDSLVLLTAVIRQARADIRSNNSLPIDCDVFPPHRATQCARKFLHKIKVRADQLKTPTSSDIAQIMLDIMND